MEDSFFGFETSVPLDDESKGERFAEPSEEEYDALNDETFGSAINTDWEEVHENLVRLRDNFNGDLQEGVDSGDAGDSDDGGGDECGNKIIFSSTATSAISTPAHNYCKTKRPDSFGDSDLELNLSEMKLEDVEFTFDNENSGNGSRLNLNSSVWALNPVKNANHDMKKYTDSIINSSLNNDSSDKRNIIPPNLLFFPRDHFSNHFDSHQSREETSTPTSMFGMQQSTLPANIPKICTLEDIERNLIIQQTMDKQQQQLLKGILQQDSKSSNRQPMQLLQHTQEQSIQKPQLTNNVSQNAPPGFSNNQSPPRLANTFLPNFSQHSIGNLLPPQSQQHQQHQLQQVSATNGRMPPGFAMYPPGLVSHLQQQAHPQQLPPHPLLNQHTMSPNFPHIHQRPLPTPHLPIALNNFAMHPNFNAMRPAGIHPASLVPPIQQPPRLPSHGNTVINPQSNSMYNMFNMRLVQEIQQNHPLLQNNARQMHQQQICMGNNLHMQQRNNTAKPSHHRREGNIANGNLPFEEFDEYANLMSTRDKHWLIGIQLSQLNTDTPYIDDYYYTVYKERRSLLNGNPRHSQAHKDNQLNHPLTQPKGHAQLILVQLGNKNGSRNGQNREREYRTSESGSSNNLNIHDQKIPYVFTPLKFENSLGKLQYGSVTAPRKIIDAEIMSVDPTSTLMGENGNHENLHANKTTLAESLTFKLEPLSSSSTGGGNAMRDVTTNAQRKSRHILLHIETLYRVTLKLEDLDNPNAMTTILMKKKKEGEHLAALEQLENANKTNDERTADSSNQQSTNLILKNRFSYDIETKEALVAKLIAGLTHEKIISIMNVRKGKALIRRIMPYIEDTNICLNIWLGVFASLQHIFKRDRDDADGTLFALYGDFKEQVKKFTFDMIVKIANAIPLSNKKSSGIFSSRFGISSLVCLILKTEEIYANDCDTTLTKSNMDSWRKFLDRLSTSLNYTIQNQTICAAIESDSIQPMMSHFTRFKDLKLDSLLALISEAKQQIN